MKKLLILFLFTTSIFAQYKNSEFELTPFWKMELFGNEATADTTPESGYYVLDYAADSVKAMWVLDPIYTIAQGETYFTDNLASTDSLTPAADADTSWHIYNILTAGQTQFFDMDYRSYYYMSEAGSAYLDPSTKSATWEWIMCPTAYKSATGDIDNNYVFSKHNSATGGVHGTWYSALRADDSLLYSKIASYTPSVYSAVDTSTTKIELYKWYYCALVLDQSKDSLIFYLNGTQEDIVPIAEPNGSLLVDTAFVYGDLELNGSAPSGTQFDGYIPQFRLSHRALTSSEIGDYGSKLLGLVTSAPSTPTIDVAQEGFGIRITPFENEFTIIYKGTSANPTTAFDTLACGIQTLLDTNISYATTYYYRCKTFRTDFSGNVYTSGYSADDTAGIWNISAEMITNQIDRDLEPVSLYASDFTAGANSWSAVNGTAGGNLDAYNVEDCLGFVSDNTNGSHFISRSLSQAAGSRYETSLYYYIPSANDTLKRSMLWTNADWDLTSTPSQTVTTTDAWTFIKHTNRKLGTGAANTSATRFYFLSPTQTNWQNLGDSIYFKDIKVSQVSNYGIYGTTHTIDSSSTSKQAGSYSLKVTTTGAGSVTNHGVQLASTKFTAATNGAKHRLRLYCYTATASTTIYFNLGDITQSLSVPTGWNYINFDFTATASTTGNIKLWFNQAATIYLDEVSLKRISE